MTKKIVALLVCVFMGFAAVSCSSADADIRHETTTTETAQPFIPDQICGSDLVAYPPGTITSCRTTTTTIPETTTTFPPISTTLYTAPETSIVTTTTVVEELPVFEEYVEPEISATSIVATGVGPFLECVKQHESRGDYTAVNPSSGAGGAYQFLQSTWNNTANYAGRGDLVGIHPSNASPWDQDQMAVALYNWQGESPWLGSGC